MWNRFMNARLGSAGAATQALVEVVQDAKGVEGVQGVKMPSARTRKDHL